MQCPFCFRGKSLKQPICPASGHAHYKARYHQHHNISKNKAQLAKGPATTLQSRFAPFNPDEAAVSKQVSVAEIGAAW